MQFYSHFYFLFFFLSSLCHFFFVARATNKPVHLMATCPKTTTTNVLFFDVVLCCRCPREGLWVDRIRSTIIINNIYAFLFSFVCTLMVCLSFSLDHCRYLRQIWTDVIELSFSANAISFVRFIFFLLSLCHHLVAWAHNSNYIVRNTIAFCHFFKVERDIVEIFHICAQRCTNSTPIHVQIQWTLFLFFETLRRNEIPTHPKPTKKVLCDITSTVGKRWPMFKFQLKSISK